MLGAYRGASATTSSSTRLAIAAAGRSPALIVLLPTGKLVTFDGAFIVDDFARFMKILTLIGSARR